MMLPGEGFSSDVSCKFHALFSPACSKDPLPIIVRHASWYNSPVFAYFVRGGGVSCTRQMVKVRLDGAPLKRDVIEMK